MIGTYKVFEESGDFAIVYIKGMHIWLLQSWECNGGGKCEPNINSLEDALQVTTDEFFEMNEVTNHIKL